jgi:hypothetical protein
VLPSAPILVAPRVRWKASGRSTTSTAATVRRRTARAIRFLVGHRNAFRRVVSKFDGL